MSAGRHPSVADAAKSLAPLAILFAFTLLVIRAPGGTGFIAGLIFSAGVALHALVFGVAASRAAFPLALWRVFLSVGPFAAIAGAAGPGLLVSPQLIEAGLFATTISAMALITTSLFGRAPTLRDAEW